MLMQCYVVLSISIAMYVDFHCFFPDFVNDFRCSHYIESDLVRCHGSHYALLVFVVLNIMHNAVECNGILCSAMYGSSLH